MRGCFSLYLEERIKRLEKEIMQLKSRIEIIDYDNEYIYRKLKEKGIILV